MKEENINFKEEEKLEISEIDFQSGSWVISNDGLTIVKLIEPIGPAKEAWHCENRSGEPTFLPKKVLDEDYVKWEPFNETQNSLFVCNGLTYFHVPKPINGSVIGEAPGIWYSYDPKDDLLTTLYDGGFDIDMSSCRPVMIEEVKQISRALFRGRDINWSILESEMFVLNDLLVKKENDYELELQKDSRLKPVNSPQIEYDVKSEYEYDVIDGKLYLYPRKCKYDIGDYIIFQWNESRYHIEAPERIGYYTLLDDYGNKLNILRSDIDNNSRLCTSKDFITGDFLVSDDFAVIYSQDANQTISFKRENGKFTLMKGDGGRFIGVKSNEKTSRDLYKEFGYRLDISLLMRRWATPEEKQGMLDAIDKAGYVYGGFDLSDHGWTWWLKKKEKKSNIENENKDAK